MRSSRWPRAEPGRTPAETKGRKGSGRPEAAAALAKKEAQPPYFFFFLVVRFLVAGFFVFFFAAIVFPPREVHSGSMRSRTDELCGG
jgi:hypothetical protein